MLHSRCAFCGHDNPAGSKFCNECGSPLHLKPCVQCDAVNDYEAAACYRCGAAFSQSMPEIQHEETPAANEEARTFVPQARTSVPEAFSESLTSAIARADASAVDVSTSVREDAPASLPPANIGPLDPPGVAADPARSQPLTDVADPQASDIASAASLVVPPDEERLSAVRDVAVARRRRRARTAIAVVLVIAAAGGLYYEYLAANPVGDWLRATQASVLEAIRSRMQPSPTAVDEAARAREPSGSQPATKADEAATAPPAVPVPADRTASPAPPSSTPAEPPPTTAEPPPTTAEPLPSLAEPPPTTAEQPPQAAPSAPSTVTPGASARPAPKRPAPDRKRRATRRSPAAFASPETALSALEAQRHEHAPFVAAAIEHAANRAVRQLAAK